MRRILLLVVVVLAGLFALQAGEYGTTDLFRQRARRARVQAEVDSLQREVDSLRGYKRRVQADPVLQERIAREEFGMVRGRELLYRFVETAPDSAPADAAAATDERVARRP